MIVHHDCRCFLGDKPCIFRRPCEGCPHYAPFGRRILIIKLAATGDVLRTTPLLRGLHRAYPGCHITWLTEPHAVPLLQGVDFIHRLMTYSCENILQLRREAFDQLCCFDKEPKATALAMEIQARECSGFGMSRYGNAMPLNPASEYAFQLGIDDVLKFRKNTKTYPELIFECAGLPYPEPQEYVLPDLTGEVSAGRDYLQSLGVGPGELKIGLNTGASDAFATKKWTEEGYAELADLLAGRMQARVLLLGGPAEAERNQRIAAAAATKPVNAGTHLPLRCFAGTIGNLDLLVTGDTLAMHIAIGMRVPVLVIMGATCHREIELYGRGTMIVSDFDCSPCYLSQCPEESNCMQAIRAPEVYEAAARLLQR
jgi:ADP-heptose:LPS heptosyltransferase